MLVMKVPMKNQPDPPRPLNIHGNVCFLLSYRSNDSGLGSIKARYSHSGPGSNQANRLLAHGLPSVSLARLSNVYSIP